MAVWGEVYAFELPFFLFWKDGFVLGRDFLRRFSTVECRHEAYPNRTQKPFSLKENGFICGRTMLPTGMISLRKGR